MGGVEDDILKGIGVERSAAEATREGGDEAERVLSRLVNVGLVGGEVVGEIGGVRTNESLFTESEEMVDEGNEGEEQEREGGGEGGEGEERGEGG